MYGSFLDLPEELFRCMHAYFLAGFPAVTPSKCTLLDSPKSQEMLLVKVKLRLQHSVLGIMLTLSSRTHLFTQLMVQAYCLSLNYKTQVSA